MGTGPPLPFWNQPSVPAAAPWQPAAATWQPPMATIASLAEEEGTHVLGHCLGKDVHADRGAARGRVHPAVRKGVAPVRR